MPVVGKQVLFGAIGLVATAIAVVGVWLPGVPTVFPLIIALWAFSKSSSRLERWVGRLPIFKHALAEAQRFERDRSIDLRIKLIAAGSAWASTLLVALTTRSILVTMIVAGIALACSIFMAIVPTRQNSELVKEE